MEPTFAWKDVPLELDKQWMEVFSQQGDGVDVSGSCPVCGHAALHRYYDGSGDRGALWEWCSSCYSYQHYSAKVPLWWNGSLDLTELNLTALPEALELARQRG